MPLRSILLALPLTAGLAAPASALTFNFSQISGDTLTPGESAAFGTAAAALSSVFSDPVTVNVPIGFRNLGSANGGVILGQTSVSSVSIGYGTFKAELAADATSASDASAVASLPATVPGGSQAVLLTTAEAKALSTPGIGPSGQDGSIEFTTAVTFADTRSALNSGTYDLIGIAEHEIGHLLGFVSALDQPAPATRDALDLFRYRAVGTLGFTVGQAAYFSIDGGVTAIASFESGSGYQASHWLQATVSGGRAALLNPAVTAGNQQDLTPLDIQALDVLGYNLAQAAAVPEPASLALLAPVLLGLLRRHRRAA